MCQTEKHRKRLSLLQLPSPGLVNPQEWEGEERDEEWCEVHKERTDEDTSVTVNEGLNLMTWRVFGVAVITALMLLLGCCTTDTTWKGNRRRADWHVRWRLQTAPGLTRVAPTSSKRLHSVHKYSLYVHFPNDGEELNCGNFPFCKSPTAASYWHAGVTLNTFKRAPPNLCCKHIPGDCVKELIAANNLTICLWRSVPTRTGSLQRWRPIQTLGLL